jgi:carboxyl-terminal processing protease
MIDTFALRTIRFTTREGQAMFTFTTAKKRSAATIVGSRPKRLLRRFSTLVIAIAALVSIAKMPCGAGDEFTFGASIAPYGTVSRIVGSPDDGDLPGKPDDEAFYLDSRRSPRGEPGLAVPPSRAPDRRVVPDRGRENSSSPAERTQRKLTSRYGNPMTVRMLRSLSPEQSVEFYREVSGLIDSRNLDPPSYQTRVDRARSNLQEALANEAFRRANGIANDSAALAAFRRELQRLDAEPIAHEAAADEMLRQTMQSANRAGVAPAAVALEFVCGATDALDPFSGFIPATSRGKSLDELAGHIVGIGVEIAPSDDGLRIVKALPNSPAADAGLKAGDIIESVDGHDMAGVTPDAAANVIAGRPGSQVVLRVRRDTRIGQFTLLRRGVELHTVSDVKMLGPNVGYLKLEKFAETSRSEIDHALSALGERGMRSLILDVRGNPGGLLTSAVAVSSKFLAQGPIVVTRGRNPADNSVEYCRGDGATDVALVVVVDEQSASASEIFAAAMQDNDRALIVGRRTFGKGCVQSHFPLQTVAGDLSLTTAHFYSPRGHLIHGEGVVPDVFVSLERSSASSIRAGLPTGTAWERDADLAAAYAAATSGHRRERSQAGTADNGRVLKMTGASVAEIIENSACPVVVEFGAPWCPHCRVLAPIVDELASKWEGRVRFAKVDVDANRDISVRYQIKDLPTLLVLIGGREVDRIVGVASQSEIVRRLEHAALGQSD